MEEASHGPSLWYEGAGSAPSDRTVDPLTAGLPRAWWSFVQVLAGLVYSALWMTESWKAGKPLLAMTKVNHVTQDLWGLLVTLGCCFAVMRFWKQRSGTFGILLCIMVAGIAIAGHKI
jgi:hypothetical protein